MALPATDNFNRSNGGLGSNWTLVDNTGSARLEVASNQCKCDTASNHSTEKWNADSFANNQYAEIEALNDSNDYGPCVRCTTDDFYTLDNFNSNIIIYHFNSDSWDTVASTANDYATNSVYRLEADGTTLTSKEDGSTSSMPSGTDSSLSSGSGGIYMYDSSAICDNFEAGNLLNVEQEGFRWRDDDGSESGATWRENQDVDDTVAKNTNIRLRIIVNASGDPDAKTFKLQYKKTAASTWRDVPTSV